VTGPGPLTEVAAAACGAALFNTPICEGVAGWTSNGLITGSVTAVGGVGGGIIDDGIIVAGSLLSMLSVTGPSNGNAVAGPTSDGPLSAPALNDLKSDTDGPPIPEPLIGGPTELGASFNISGVPNALNNDCMLRAPFFNSAKASEPFEEICSSDTTAKFSVTLNFSALDT
jgi:hypothetical protein